MPITCCAWPSARWRRRARRRPALRVPAGAGGEDDAVGILGHRDRLDGAIQRGEMLMLYQPQVRCTTAAPVGAEALMRWDTAPRLAVARPVHPDRRAHRPDQDADDLGAEHRAAPGQRVEACVRRAVRGGERAGGAGRAARPARPGRERAEAVGPRPRAAGAGDHRALAGRTPEHSFRILSRIRALGVKVSIDDFGTGYSCLAYFKQHPRRRAQDRQVASSPACSTTRPARRSPA